MIKWFWSMKKPNAVLIWDTYKLTNFSSARFFEIKSNLEHQKIVKKDIYFGQKIVDNIRNEIRKNISSDPGYPDRISKKVYDTEKSVISKINKLTDKYFKKCSDKELCSIFSKCYKQVSIMEIPMSYRGNVQLSDILTETIKQELAKKLRAQGKLKLLDEYFLALSTPKRESYMSLGQKMVLELAVLKIKNDPSFDKELREHTKNFAWMGCVMFEGMPLTQEDFLKDINSKIEQNPEILLNKMEDSRKDSETKIKTIVTSLEFSKETLKTLEQLREWYHLRTYAKDCISKAIAKTMPVLLEIAARKNMTYDDLSFLQAREIENIFKISKEALQNRIEERKKGWAAVATKEDVYYFTGQDIKKVKEKEEIDRNAVEIKGQVASRGFVKGVVRLVKDATELGKVKKGDILVTSMTTTDFTPILDKISGLITDEGGLTCHAAIVSRELGIPCIIGTKHATKTLKDDDKIELDAEKGIIRKL